MLFSLQPFTPLQDPPDLRMKNSVREHGASFKEKAGYISGADHPRSGERAREESRAFWLFHVTVHLSRHSDTAALSFSVTDPMKELVLPDPADRPLRKHRLWEETCLEFFLAPKDSPRYWEINLSPSGHWNVYRFASYREGMQEEAAFTSLPFRVERRENLFLLDLDLHLGGIVDSETPLQAGISAVLKRRNGETTYWALSHTGRRPDFHRRDSFTARL